MGEPCVEDEEGLSPALGGHSSHKTSDGPGALGWVILAMGLPDPGWGGEGSAVLVTWPSWFGYFPSQSNTLSFSLCLGRSSRSWGRRMRPRMSSLNSVSRISTSSW